MAMKVWLHYMLKKQSNQSTKEKKVNEFENTTSTRYTDAPEAQPETLRRPIRDPSHQAPLLFRRRTPRKLRPWEYEYNRHRYTM